MIQFAKLVTHASDAEFDAKVDDYLDLDAFARFMAVTVLLSNRDSILGMGQNYLVYLQPGTRRFLFMPWDLDHSFGQFMGGPNDAAQLDIRKPWNGSVRFLERVFKVNAFMRLYLGHVRTFNASIFAPGRLLAQVDELAVILRPAIAEESAEKLQLFDQVVSGTSDGSALPDDDEPGSGGPGPGMGRPGMGRGQRGSIRGFVPARANAVQAQLDRPVGQAATAAASAEPPGAPGGPEGPGGPFDPGAMLASQFLHSADTSHDGTVSRAEFLLGVRALVHAWDADRDGALDQHDLVAGLARDFIPTPGQRGPGGPDAR